MNELTAEHKALMAASLQAKGFNSLVGLEFVDAEIGTATLRLEMRDELRQPHGLLHGGAIATLIDTAMAYAVISRLAENEKAATADLTVHYLRPHTEGSVTCTARVLKAGRKMLTVTADAADADGRIIATALASYSKLG